VNGAELQLAGEPGEEERRLEQPLERRPGRGSLDEGGSRRQEPARLRRAGVDQEQELVESEELP
jgi:hypothetical protein